MRILLSVLAVVTFAQELPMDNMRVIDLFKVGTPVEEISRQICSTPSASFRLDPGSTRSMVAAGIPEEVIKAMAARSAGRCGQLSAVKPTAKEAPAATPKPQGRIDKVRPGSVDLFGGYSYVSVGTLGARVAANGFESSSTFAMNRWIGIEGTASGYFKSFQLAPYGLIGSIPVRDYVFAGGPRVNYGPVFFHVLLGVDRLTGTYRGVAPYDGISTSLNGFTTIFGGGLQRRIKHTAWAWRTSVDYAVAQHNIYGGIGFAESNLRISTGVVYTVNPPNATQQ